MDSRSKRIWEILNKRLKQHRSAWNYRCSDSHQLICFYFAWFFLETWTKQPVCVEIPIYIYIKFNINFLIHIILNNNILCYRQTCNKQKTDLYIIYNFKLSTVYIVQYICYRHTWWLHQSDGKAPGREPADHDEVGQSASWEWGANQYEERKFGEQFLKGNQQDYFYRTAMMMMIDILQPLLCTW